MASCATVCATLGSILPTILPGTLPKARRLFAKAIETPGGLKIQTIHSFCAALLRRFPLEAGVSPAFVEMDDRAARQLREEVIERVATDAPDVMARFARHFTAEEPQKFLAEITNQRDLFTTSVSDADLRELHGVGSDETEESLLTDIFLGSEQTIIDALLPLLKDSGTNDAKLFHDLTSLDLGARDLATLRALEKAFLAQSGKNAFQPKTQPPTKGVKSALPTDTADQFEQFRMRVADARPKRLALGGIRKTRALHDFALAALPRLDAQKTAAGLLDFDDLIRKARELLTRKSVAEWVLFRLDGGIDHLLVDEAQDTSPDQWAVIKALAAEFTAGRGAADQRRTMFIVGDPKQSIYSFQGADPAEFGRMRDHFGAALGNIGEDLHARELLHSFRSASPILSLVDQVFTGDLTRGMGERVEHIPARAQMPGRVDLWDWIAPDEGEDETPWYDPVDQLSTSHHTVRLADKIAKFIADRLAHGQITTKDGTRRIRPGDFLILVQSRSDIFHEIIRACKDRALPMAGADRLRIGAELGVRDLVALLRYLATPEDDLSLATVLRSPLCGISEEDLHTLAYGRPSYLRAAFEAAKDRFPEAYEMLRDLRDKADFLRPYDLLERCLTRHGGRDRIVARLGVEAEEGIAALLDQAEAFERHSIPGLTTFLEWLEGDEVTIKRQIDSNSDQIRVMTIHGAKGLEAPVVILPETAEKAERMRDQILDADGISLWKAASAEMPAVQSGLVEAQKDKQREERLRLLYVAMTRAENWLIVAGSGRPGKEDGAAWYNHVEQAMADLGAVPENGMKARIGGGDWPADLPANDARRTRPEDALDPMFRAMPPVPERTAKLLLPSDMGGAKALPGGEGKMTEPEAKARGTLIHRLLEHLPHVPRQNRPAAMSGLVSDYTPTDPQDLLSVVERILDRSDLSFIFAPGTLAEVSLTADIGGRALFGTVDRLIVGDTTVTAIDFKSNAVIPASPDTVPEGILRQLGSYAIALARIYPEHRIETAVLWTETAELMAVPGEISQAALARAVQEFSAS